MTDQYHYYGMAMTPAQLLTRLEAAEAVCLMFGWTGTHADDSDRDAAAYILWSRWHDLAGHQFTRPAAHPELSDEVIAGLAAALREIRERTLKRIFGVKP